MPPSEKLQSRLVIRGTPATLDLLSGLLFDAGAAGLAEEEGALVAYPRDEAELARFQAVIGAYRSGGSDDPPEIQLESFDSNWESEWLKHLSPQKVSPSFTLCPIDSPPPSTDSEPIWFAPRASFGSGEHPTTQLAATFVEQYVRAHPGLHCLDVGTGSGVLALVAVKSGAEHVLAVDIDDVSVESAGENARLNGCDHQITVARGSADITDETFALVIANINTPILLEIHSDLAARVSADGVIALTGLLDEDINDVRVAFEGRNLRLAAEHLQNGWALLILQSTQ